MALLADGLLPASFRGAPFAVISDDVATGRRLAMHQYPGRDEPWAEDMGRAARRYRFRGFIVDGDVVFLGGPIQLQRALLLAAFERKDAGVLVHPTLGILNVCVLRASIGQDLGAGTMSSVDVEFVESGKRTFPSLLSSGSGLLSAATLVRVGLALDVARVVGVALKRGANQQDGIAAASSWASQIANLGADATTLNRLAAQLPGNNGRFAGGANVGYVGETSSPYAAGTTVTDLAAIASIQRAAIATAGAGMVATMGTIGTGDLSAIGTAATALVDTLLSACADPADAIRLLLQLAEFAPDGEAIGAALGVAFRRAVAAALAASAGQYQPASYEDAFALLTSVVSAIDAVALEAADTGNTDSYDALRKLKVEVVKDLRARGASLAHIASFSLPGPMPAAAMAQRLYRDPARSADLVRQTRCIHPLFMPTAFEALAA